DAPSADHELDNPPDHAPLGDDHPRRAVNSCARPPMNRLNRKTWALLALIVLVAIAARAYRIGTASLWLDEQISLESSAGWGLGHLHLPTNVLLDPPPDVITLGPPSRWVKVPVLLARDDNHPPLYILVLRGWRTIYVDS